MGKLEFSEVEERRFPALPLAYRALEQGQGACLVLNAANEVAVAAFLSGAIRFVDIVSTVERALQAEDLADPRSMDEVFSKDAAVRAKVASLLPEGVAV